jgi:hypothetical protein
MNELPLPNRCDHAKLTIPLFGSLMGYYLEVQGSRTFAFGGAVGGGPRGRLQVGAIGQKRLLPS